MFELTLAWRQNGMRQETYLGMATTISKALDVTNELLRSWEDWYRTTHGDFSTLHSSNPLRHFEGGEVFLRDVVTGEAWVYDPDYVAEWKEL